MGKRRRFHDEIRNMLLDIADNMDVIPPYPNHADMKRDWLNAVADAANDLIRTGE